MRRTLGFVAISATLATGALAATGAASTAVAAEPPALAPSAAAAARDAVRIDFDDLSGPDGEPVTEVRVTGKAGATGTVATRAGGELLAATARPSHGRAVSYPSFDPSSEAPRAVIRVLDDVGRDNLSPKKRDFSFGADFILDAVSSESGSADDGDNLVQRGLFDDVAQYKLQVDARHPSCRLKGTVEGVPVDIEVRSRVEVDDSHWYSAACVRDGRRLEIVVSRFNDDGTSKTTRDSVRGDNRIKLVMEPRTVPLSVGGKLYADGTVDFDSDQFNGVVDEAYLSVD